MTRTHINMDIDWKYICELLLNDVINNNGYTEEDFIDLVSEYSELLMVKVKNFKDQCAN